MAIGTLGDITFNVSRERVQTFEDFNIESSARIATHENLQNKPIVEFIGPGLDKVSLKMNWSISCKLNPAKEIKGLVEKKEKGEVVSFFLGGKPVGKGKYLIESISRLNRVIDNRGNILSMEITINLIEYAENAKKVKVIKTDPPKSSATMKPKPKTNKIPKVKTSTASKTKKPSKPKNNTTKKVVNKQKTVPIPQRGPRRAPDPLSINLGFRDNMKALAKGGK